MPIGSSTATTTSSAAAASSSLAPIAEGHLPIAPGGAQANEPRAPASAVHESRPRSPTPVAAAAPRVNPQSNNDDVRGPRYPMRPGTIFDVRSAASLQATAGGGIKMEEWYEGDEDQGYSDYAYVSVIAAEHIPEIANLLNCDSNADASAVAKALSQTCGTVPLVKDWLGSHRIPVPASTRV
ncbi:MAG TPA: hypothetical protein VHA82_07415 [Ramlibacter sp.]|uniref:hypothetical protein n=1 Tax=Ramlibacter sp. TaxID=1917967 RepID=UPI002CCC81D1|nr:hypothetical protein [Ramlibacter sp.]HVZ43623.1 hypothetical protein [Ramlibacter sp.]